MDDKFLERERLPTLVGRGSPVWIRVLWAGDFGAV